MQDTQPVNTLCALRWELKPLFTIHCSYYAQSFTFITELQIHMRLNPVFKTSEQDLFKVHYPSHPIHMYECCQHINCTLTVPVHLQHTQIISQRSYKYHLSHTSLSPGTNMFLMVTCLCFPVALQPASKSGFHSVLSDAFRKL